MAVKWSRERLSLKSFLCHLEEMRDKEKGLQSSVATKYLFSVENPDKKALKMTEIPAPRLYLITPSHIDLDGAFIAHLSTIMDYHDIACLRLSLETQDEYQIGKISDRLRDLCHTKDVAIVIENHMILAEKFGLDGVHLSDGARHVAKARKKLGSDAIVGCFCGASRHAGMTAGEAGADYISFGPVSGTELNDGSFAQPELFDWWSQMIEVPVIAEGAVTPKALADVGGYVDFIALGQELWTVDDPNAHLSDLLKQISAE